MQSTTKGYSIIFMKNPKIHGGLPPRKEKIMQNKLRQLARYIKAQTGCRYKDFAIAIGVSESTIYNWLGNQHNLSIKNRQKLEKLFIAILKAEQ